MEVRLARPDDAEWIGALLAEALAGDPVWSWTLRTDARRGVVLARHFTAAARACIPLGACGVTSDKTAALLTRPPPGVRPATARALARSLPLLYDFAGSPLRLARLYRLTLALQRRYPAQPHSYAYLLGVRPDTHGRPGSALIRAYLALCDAEGVPVYAEATTERSARLYQRFGFVTRERLQLRGAPPVWLMWREPQSPH